VRRPRFQGAYIDPARFVNKATPLAEQTPFVPQHSFTDFALVEALQQNITEHGYTQPTPVQDAAIKPILDGCDLIGLANTGTGKTAAFLLPIMSRLSVTRDQEAVLIIVPTRELAGQIADEFKSFSRGLSLQTVLCVGGANIRRQVMALKRRPNIIVGTPGRLKDLVERRALRLDGVNILVLDEADQMLDMGFLPDIRFLIGKTSPERQSLCFSATLPIEIERLVKEILKDPVTVSVRTSVTSDHVDQDVIVAGSKDQKIKILAELLHKAEFEKVLVFGETKYGMQKLAETLVAQGIDTEVIHGNKSQAQRQKALKNFKEDRVKVLVATDVAARGLDIPNVSHVINFDIPHTYEDYIHRIGRTGRAGNLGKALTFVNARP
jgi:ATP-dependent RNA helicase RhlE